MSTSTDLDAAIHAEFGARLEPAGFAPSGERRWVRETKLPIREIFAMGAQKRRHVLAAVGLLVRPRAGRREPKPVHPP